MRRVVGGADRIDSHGLHEGEVLARPGLVENAPFVGTHLVPVHAVERQGRPVGGQHAAVDTHAPESDAQRAVPTDEAVSPLDAHVRVVEGGVVRAPRAHIPQ